MARSSRAWSGRWPPSCTLHVLSLHVDPAVPGGGVLESELVNSSTPPSTASPGPDLINLSAGCPTRLNLPARALEDWWADVSPELDMVLVAAAGNNASPWEFWPASFPWAVGVGSLDRDGQVSDFSNWGDSVDVLALGRNLVNAFPRGRYVCQESPDRGTSGSSTTCSRGGAEPRSRRRSSPG